MHLRPSARLSRLALLIALAIARGASGQTLPHGNLPLTLGDALGEARRNAPALGASQARLDAARARVSGVMAWMPPMVGLTAMEVPAGSFDPTSGDGGVALMASQTVPWPGKRRAAAEAARLGAEADETVLEMVRRSIDAEVVTAYVRLAFDERDRLSLRAQEEILREIASIATRRYAVGAGTQPDALRASLERTRLGAELLALRARRAENARSLRVLLARDEPAGDSLALGTLLPEIVASLERLLTVDSAGAPARPELRLSGARQDAARARLEAVRLGFRPDVTVSAQYAIVRKPYGMEGRDMWSAGVSITVPIAPWSRGAVDAERAVWEAELRALGEEKRGLEQRIAAEVAAIDEQALAARDALRLYEADLIPQAEIAYRAVLGAYALGNGDLTGLLDARRTLADLRRTTEAARARYAEALVRQAQAHGLSFAPITR